MCRELAKLIVTGPELVFGVSDSITSDDQLCRHDMTTLCFADMTTMMFTIGCTVLFVAITSNSVIPSSTCLSTGLACLLIRRCGIARMPGIRLRNLRNLVLQERAKIQMAKKGRALIVDSFGILPFQTALLHLFRDELMKSPHAGPGVTDGFDHE